MHRIGFAEFQTRGEVNPGVWVACHDETWEQPESGEVCPRCLLMRDSPWDDMFGRAWGKRFSLTQSTQHLFVGFNVYSHF